MNPFDLFRLQTEIEYVKIRAHVAGVVGPRQRYHADVEGEPENDLADVSTMLFGNLGQFRAGHHLAVGGQQ